MPGIPRSQRCQGCMRRKIRCDLNWPVCSPCKRSGTPCSGPPTGAKFIHNGCHRTKSAAAHASTSGEQQALVSDVWPQRPAPQAVTRPPPPHTIVDVSSRAVPGGASYACFRLSNGPRANPTTLADRLAAHLSRLLNKDPHGGSLLGMSYVVHLPQRMAHSPALRDCVALFCSGWSSYLRGADPDDLVDHKAYGKALRSLQRALDSRQDQLRCETLAAISILERFDVLFDRNRGYNRTMHGRGIHSLMLKRGPPDPNDELDRRLAVENRSVLLSLWVVEDGDNFFLAPEWKAALEPPPVHSGSSGETPVRTHSFIGYLGIWPRVVREMRRLQGGEMPADEVVVNAARLQGEVQELLGEIEADGVPLLEEARKNKLFSVVADPDPPIGEKYEFAEYGAAEMIITYYAVRSLIHNIVWLLQKLQGLPDDAAWAGYLDDCYNCWMAMPYLRSMGSLASMQNSTPFLLSYEAASPEVKKHILDWIIEQDQHKKRFPDDREQVERIVLNVGRGMVGRVTFDTSPPPSAPSSPP